MDAGPDLLPLTPGRRRGAGRDAGLRGRLRPDRRAAGRHRRPRHRPGVGLVRRGRRLDRHALPRRRAAPLRLEHVQLRPLPVRAAPAHRAPLPGGPGPALVPDHDPGRQGRPAGAEAGQDAGGRRAGQAGRLLPAAHRPLRTRGHLPELPRRSERRRRPGRRGVAGPHVVRGARPVGGRPRLAAPGVRHVVAHRPGRRDHQRMGHPVDVRGWRGGRAAARPEVRPQAAFLGPAPAPARAGGGPRRRAPDGAGAAAGARPDEGVRVRRRGGVGG